MANADPENKIGNVERPAHRAIQAPRANSGHYRVHSSHYTYGQQQQGDAETNPPASTGLRFQQLADVAGYSRICFLTLNERPPQRRIDRMVQVLGIMKILILFPLAVSCAQRGWQALISRDYLVVIARLDSHCPWI